jgi:dCMP deaminase
MFTTKLDSNIKKWDLRFLAVAKLISSWSKDPSTQTGAIVVRDNRIIATGYNGFPRAIMDTPERLHNREVKYSLTVHCEMNAVLNSEAPVRGATLYTWPFFSCTRCAVAMLAAGITRFVAPECPDDKKDRWGADLEQASRIAMEGGATATIYRRTE